MSAPIFNMLMKYANSRPVPFHMPGHLMGRGLPDLFKEAGMLDITEIPGSDCLHDPEGVIAQAQDLAAQLFGAGQTFFLVNGSTVGIHTMIRSSVKPGGKILVGRDSHRSVLNAAAIFGVEPVFIMPEYDENAHLPLGYTADSVEKAIADNPEIEAVLLTRPNYYGVASRLDVIAEVLHSRGIPLLIDEAHGAHFLFEQSLPVPALELGADVCVQSLHKTLPALTQTALLHVSGNSLVDSSVLFENLSMLQSTSPSYILMASIDIARDLMERDGKNLYGKLKKAIEKFDRDIRRIAGVRREATGNTVYDTDFSRIVLSFEKSGVSGYEAERILRETSGIYPEMADPYNVVLIATPFHDENDFERLLDGIKKVVSVGSGNWKNNNYIPFVLPERKMGFCEALRKERETIPLCEAAGRTAGAAITPYPPGIPLVYPGEMISADLVRYATEILDSGGKVHGIIDYMVRVVR